MIVVEQDLGLQTAENVATNSGSFGTTPTAGNMIVVLISGWNAGDFEITQVTDNQGNTYNLAAHSPDAGADWDASIYYAEDISASGTFTITVDPTPASDNYIAWTAVEVSGLETSSSLDVTQGNSSASGDANTGTSAATDTADEIVFACMSLSSADSTLNISVPTTGYTRIAAYQDGTAIIGFDASYKIISSTGVQSANWSHDNTSQDGWGAVLATFRIASGGSIQNITGVVFSDTDTFATGVVATSYSIIGDLFVDIDDFKTSEISLTISGNLFSAIQEFYTATIVSGAQISAVLYENGNNFHTSVITQSQPVDCVLFENVNNFHTTAITSVINIQANNYIDQDVFHNSVITGGIPVISVQGLYQYHRRFKQ